MPCLDPPRQCLALHAGPRIAEWQLPSPGVQGTGDCPSCGRGFTMSVGTRGARLVACCHAGCETSVLRAALAGAGIPAECMPALGAAPGSEPKTARPSRARPVVDPGELAALLLSGIPPMSMKLAGLEMTGLTTTEALDELKVRREHRARVITGRAPFSVQNRR